jgi:Na+/proline symporter
MKESLILLSVVLYFILIWIVARIGGRKSSDNESFFTAGKKSPWWLVAVGMIGSSISGVSFVSVPGMVGGIQFTYLQTVLGFFVGYLFIAYVLLPVYYKLNLTSIYSYLDERFGKNSHKTGAWIFIISKSTGAAARLYIVAIILQNMIFDSFNIPFIFTVLFILVIIWLYSFQSGIKSILWTDFLQAIILVVALLLMTIQMVSTVDTSETAFWKQWYDSDLTRIFVWDDWISKQHFVKQFVSGILIAIVMTGLDQDMMQKNLTCKTLPDAQKNMRWYGLAFIPVNFMFLLLGFAVLQFATSNQIALPEKADQILPFMANNHFSIYLLLLFVIGIAAAALSSADSALASLTTSFYVDILGKPNHSEKRAKRTRMFVHAAFTLFFILIIYVFRLVNNTSVIDAIYIMASYTYGPLLGLFAAGLFTKIKPADKHIPWIAVFAPLFCFVTDYLLKTYAGYALGYELLLLNGLVTFIALYISSLYDNKNSRVRHQ